MALAGRGDQNMQLHDRKKKPSTADQCAAQLRSHGVVNAIVITDNFAVSGRAVFKAEAKNECVAVRAYLLQDQFDCNKAASEVIRLSSLHHPHIVQPKSLIRTKDFLCVVVEYANGGDLYRMVRRGGPKGLPVPAARFLFQQLILALDFCHGQGIFLRNINPSNLLVFWNDKGMPILKISDFHLAKDVNLSGGAYTPVVATMYTCPHMVRQAGREEKYWEDLADVCDVWSAVVTLYFLLEGRWPFSKSQITSWGVTREADWADHKLALQEIKSDMPEAVKELFATVFKGGCKSAQDYKEECPSIKDIIQWDWFKQDLPDKADQMTKIYNEKTAIRRASPELQKLLVGDGSAKGGKHEDGDDPGGVADLVPAQAVTK